MAIYDDVKEVVTEQLNVDPEVVSDEHDAEVVWQSEQCTPAGDPFMTVKKARGYYYYAERGGQDSIAFILYDAEREDSYGLIYEAKPPLDERTETLAMGITAFGGSIDMNASIEEICKVEVLEEAGYDVEPNKIGYIGSTLVSSQMSQICHGFFVDVTGLTAGKTETDIYNEEQEKKDPDEFKHNKVVWFTTDELMDNNDWKSTWIFSKMFHASLKQQMNAGENK